MFDRKIALNPPAFFIVILTNQERKLKVDDLYILTARQHQPLTCSCATSVNHKSTRHSQPASIPGLPLEISSRVFVHLTLQLNTIISETYLTIICFPFH